MNQGSTTTAPAAVLQLEEVTRPLLACACARTTGTTCQSCVAGKLALLNQMKALIARTHLPAGITEDDRIVGAAFYMHQLTLGTHKATNFTINGPAPTPGQGFFVKQFASGNAAVTDCKYWYNYATLVITPSDHSSLHLLMDPTCNVIHATMRDKKSKIRISFDIIPDGPECKSCFLVHEPEYSCLSGDFFTFLTMASRRDGEPDQTTCQACDAKLMATSYCCHCTKALCLGCSSAICADGFVHNLTQIDASRVLAYQMLQGLSESLDTPRVVRENSEKLAASASCMADSSQAVASDLSELKESMVGENGSVKRIEEIFGRMESKLTSMADTVAGLLPMLQDLANSAMAKIGTTCKVVFGVALVTTICGCILGFLPKLKKKSKYQLIGGLAAIFAVLGVVSGIYIKLGDTIRKYISQMYQSCFQDTEGPHNEDGLSCSRTYACNTCNHVVDLDRSELIAGELHYKCPVCYTGQFELADESPYMPPQNSETDTKDTRPDPNEQELAELGQRMDIMNSLPTSRTCGSSSSEEDSEEYTTYEEQPNGMFQYEGNPDKNGVSSFLALTLALVKQMHDPSIDGWAAFKSLRKDSMAIGVGISAVDYLAAQVPEQIRMTIYSKYGYGSPKSVTLAEREILSRGFWVHELMSKRENRTAANKRVWHSIYSSVNVMLKSNKFIIGSDAFAQKVGQTVYTLLTQQAQFVNAIADNKGFRLKTIGIWLYGIRGSGKSTLVGEMCKKFAHWTPPDKQQHGLAITDKYWSGYGGHWAVVIDDLGSDIAKIQEISLFQTLLTFLSNVPCQVNMAFEKGMPFTSHVLAVSSNRTPEQVMEWTANGHHLTNAPAVTRRFRGTNGIEAEVLVKKAFVFRDIKGETVCNQKAIAASAARYPGEYKWLLFRVATHQGPVMMDYTAFEALFAVCYTASLDEYKRSCEAQQIDHANDVMVKACDKVREDAFAADLAEQFNAQVLAEPMFNYQMERGAQRRVNKVIDALEKEGKQVPVEVLKKNLVIKEKTINRFRTALSSGFKQRGRPPYRSRSNKPRLHSVDASVESKTEHSQEEKGNNFVADQISNSESLTQALSEHKDKGSAFADKASVETCGKLEAARAEAVSNGNLEEFRASENGKAFFKMEMERYEQKLEDEEGLEHAHVPSDFGWWDKSMLGSWDKIVDRVNNSLVNLAKTDWRKVAAVVTISLAAVVAITKVITLVNGSEVFESKDDTRGYDKTGGQYRAPSKFGSYAKSVFTNTKQMLEKEPFFDKVSRNQVEFSPHAMFNANHIGYGMMLGARRVLLNVHYIENIKSFPARVTYKVQGKVFYATMYKKDLVYQLNSFEGKTDLMFWSIPRGSDAIPNDSPCITQHFISERDLKKTLHTNNTGSKVYYLSFKDGKATRKYSPTSVLRKVRYSGVQDQDGETLTLDAVYESDVLTEEGDCGSILTDGIHILGIHFIGKHSGISGISRHMGVAQVLPREDLQDYFTAYEMSVGEINDSSLDYLPPGSLKHGADDSGIPRSGYFLLEASLPSPVFIQPKTQYVNSGMAANGSKYAAACKLVPAIMSPKDPRYKGGAKTPEEFLASIMDLRYGKPQQPIDPRLLHAATSKVISKVFNQSMDSCPIRAWSLHETLNPRLIGSILGPIPRGTSAGMLHTGNGKKDYIAYNEADQLYFATPKLEVRFQEILDIVSEGANPLFIFKDFVKDEVLPPAKVVAKNGRTVSGSPMDLCIMAKAYFGAFVNVLHTVPFTWGHTIALNTLGHDWDTMLRRLHTVSPTGFGGDYKSFDSTMNQQFMWVFFRVVDDWYKEHGEWTSFDSSMRWMVIYNTCFSKHVVGRTVFSTLWSLPSGSWLTAVMNSVWNKVLELMAFAALAETSNENGTLAGTFMGHDTLTKSFVLGDDNMHAVDKRIAHWYNAMAYGKVMASLGIKYTPPDKEGVLQKENVPLEDISFLSCGTRIGNDIPGMHWYPVVEEGTLRKCVNYVRKGEMTTEEAIDTNIVQSLDRVFMSGRERYNLFYNDVVPAFRKLVPGSQVTFPTYEEQLLKYAPIKEVKWVCSYQMGISVSTTRNNISDVAGGGVETNATNRFETKTDVKAKAGNDAPNVPCDQVQILRTGTPAGSSGDRVSFFQTMGISNEPEAANMTTMNTGDDCALVNLMAPTYRESVKFNTEHEEGTILWHSEICPNSEIFHAGAGLGSRHLPTAMSSVASLHTAWRGTIKYGFNAIASSLHSARLVVGVIYGSHTVPANLGEVTGQRYMVFEINSETKNTVVEVPYVSTTRLKEIYRGQASPESWSTGIIFLAVMNSLRAPASCSQSIEINITEGTGDLHLVLPFDANNTIRYEFEQPVPEEEAFEIDENKCGYQMLGAEMQVVNSKSGFDTAILMSSVSDTSVHHPHPIIETVQSLAQYLRRSYPVAFNNDLGLQQYKYVNIGSVFGQGKETWMCYSPIDKMSKFFRFYSGPSQMLAYTDQSSIGLAFYPFVLGEPPRKGIFSQSGSVVVANDGVNFGQAFTFGGEVRYTGGVIPMTTINNALILQHFESEITPDSLSGVVQVQSVANDPSLMCITWCAGDRFRLGVRFAIPHMNFAPIAVMPDTWPQPFVPPFDVDEADVKYQMDPPPTATGVESVGVVMTDTTVFEPEVHSVVPNTSDAKIIGQPQLTFTNFMEREQWIGNLNWSTTDVVNSGLFSRPVPTGLLLNTAKRAFESYKFKKMDAIVTLKTQATAFHSGRLAMFTVPATADSDSQRLFLGVGSVNPTFQVRRNVTFAEHVFVDAAASSSASIRIPYRYFKAYLEGKETMAWVYVSVFNQLQVGIGGDTTVSCTLYARFEETDLRVINPS